MCTEVPYRIVGDPTRFIQIPVLEASRWFTATYSCRSYVYEPDEFHAIFLHTSSLCGSYFILPCWSNTYWYTDVSMLVFLRTSSATIKAKRIRVRSNCNITEGITTHLFCLLSWLQATPAEEEVGTRRIGASMRKRPWQYCTALSSWW